MLLILVMIDIALSTAKLMTFLEERKREVLKPKVEELEEAISKSGKWQNKDDFWECSRCGWFNDYSKSDFHYCPKCGARMDKEGNDGE